MIQPTQGARYFLSAPSVSLNCSSQSNPASVLNPNLTSVKGKDKKGFTPTHVLNNPDSAAACFYKRVEGEACGVLIPAGNYGCTATVCHKAASAVPYSPVSPQCSLPPVLWWYRTHRITSLAHELYIAPPARHLHHCSLLFGSPDCPEWKYQVVKYLLEFCAVTSSPLLSHSYYSMQ